MDETKTERKSSLNSNIYCCVPQCSSYYEGNRSFHMFPLNKKIRLEWIRVLKIGKGVSKYMRVCSDHFKDEDYFFNKQYKSKIHRLKKDVIPSKKIPVGTHDKHIHTNLAAKRLNRLNRRKALTKVTSVVKDITQDAVQNSVNDATTLSDDPGISSLSPNASVGFADKSVQVNVSEDFASFDITKIINSNFKLKVFTGIPNIILLNEIVKITENYDNTKTKFSSNNKVILTLMRLKLDLTFTTLAVLFNISAQTARMYFHKTIKILSVILGAAVRFPDKEEIMHNMPICFSKFKSTRIVLDCTEIPIQASKCLNCRIKTYSYYKGRHTCKFLIGVSPSGMITFISRAYGGRTSDKAIFNLENLIVKLDPLDSIMVDKGFLIEKECSENLIKLIRPPFLKKNTQLPKEEVERTVEIARARVHVERSIQRIKIFKIFKNTIPWSLLPQIDNIMTVVAGLTNLDTPILAINKF